MFSENGVQNHPPHPKTHLFSRGGGFLFSKNKTAGGNGTTTPLGLGSKLYFSNRKETYCVCRHNRCLVCRHIGFGWGAAGPKWFRPYLATYGSVWDTEYWILHVFSTRNFGIVSFGADFEPGDPHLGPGAHIWTRGPNLGSKFRPRGHIWAPILEPQNHHFFLLENGP